MGRPAGPSVDQQRPWQRTAEGQQVGAMAHRAALPPVLPFGLHQDEHFDLARGLAFYPTPFEVAPALGLDLRYAAEVTAAGRGHLRARRRGAMAPFASLSVAGQGWMPVFELDNLHLSAGLLYEAAGFSGILPCLLLLCVLVSRVLFGMAPLPVRGFPPTSRSRWSSRMPRHPTPG